MRWRFSIPGTKRTVSIFLLHENNIPCALSVSLQVSTISVGKPVVQCPRRGT